ncbi:hypothetical protein QU487_15485 [Crenobacter sp. SG2305]|uniref:PilW family protein n=1 Tax=Crenobacter oryzisoli TaxID=3056844 RepID=UPI0025AACD53|nr:hypothetical protein [Crenobacter sp. SG2305]MDN0084142.1 hypothetical protein [Crenobacter sp. SG2305]
MRRQHGRTLIELMLTLALAMMLLALMLPVLLGAARLALLQERQQAVQQDARLALTTLVRDLRMAGHFGCASLDPDGALAGSLPWSGTPGFGVGSSVVRLQYGQAGSVLTALERDAGGGRLRGLSARLTGGETRLGEARFLVLASCRRAGLLDTAGIGRRVGTDGYRLDLSGASLPLEHGTAVGHPAEQLELLRLVSRVYVVGRHGGRQGLYRFELGDDGRWQGPVELAPGVTALTVEPIREGACPAARLWQVTLEIGSEEAAPAQDGRGVQRRYQTRVAGRGGAACPA